MFEAEQMDTKKILTLLESVARHIIPPSLPPIQVHVILHKTLEAKSFVVQSNTMEWNYSCAKHIDTHLGDLWFASLNSAIIQEFYNTVSVKSNGKLLSRRFMQGIYELMEQMIQYAIDNGYLLKSPIGSSVHMPTCAEVDPLKRFMDYAELVQLLDIIRDSMLYTTLVKLLVMTGLRIGEAMGLFWSDIDEKNQIIHVRRGVIRDFYYDPVKQKRKMQCVLGEAKTQKSVRDVPVVEEVITLLHAWRNYIQSNPDWITFIAQNQNQHLIFPNRKGGLQNINTLRSKFVTYINDHGGKHLNVGFHRMRHSYGSFLLEQGEELITVSRLLGHKNINITADIYCTVTDRLKQQAAEKTKNIWNNLHPTS